MTQELESLPENPTPQDFGFPENPTTAELQRWARQEAFLQAYAKHGSVAAASVDTGIAVSTVESWDYRDTHGFKRRLAHAKILALGYGELELADRVYNGYVTPVIHDGEITSWYRKKDPKDLYFMLKRHEPAYKDNYQQVTNNDNRQVHVTYNLPHEPTGRFLRKRKRGEDQVLPSAEELTNPGEQPTI